MFPEVDGYRLPAKESGILRKHCLEFVGEILRFSRIATFLATSPF